MANFEWFLVDFFNLVYHLSWLAFLIRKHYGQVTTTAVHIFELNLQLNVTINYFLFIITVDLDVLPWGTMTEILHVTMFYSYLLAMAGSQIQTAIFLKTLNVNTMMTNTAGKIILFLFILSVVTGISVTLVQRENQYEIEYCEFLKPNVFYQFTVPSTVVLVIVLVVLVFAVFRSIKIRRRISDNEDGRGHEMRHGDTPSQDRLFTVQAMLSELTREIEESHVTPSQNMENDIVVEEIVSVESCSAFNNVLDDERVDENLTSTDQLSIGMVYQEISQENTSNLENSRNGMIMTRKEQHINQCLPGINVMDSINKYLKNALLSLLFLIAQLPWSVTALIGFITNAECDSFRVVSEICFYSFISSLTCLPFLIKIKLDRLSQ